MACFATPYGLRYAAHCFHRAHAQNNRAALIPAGGTLGVTSDNLNTFGIDGETTTKRSDFGINYGLRVLGDEVTLNLEAEFKL